MSNHPIADENAIYHRQAFRMPDGSVTKDEDAYLSAWKDLGERVVKFLPSYRVGGYDPGILLHPKDVRESGSFTLPARAAMEIVKHGTE